MTHTLLKNDLAPFLLSTTTREDPHHPDRGPTALFNGCYDYHSAVHGVWCLIRAFRILKNSKYKTHLEKLLTPENLVKENEFLKENPKFEMPYGRAWVLRLAIEYDMTFSVKSETQVALKRISETACESLISHIMKIKSPILEGIHGNTAFALWHLWDYMVFYKRERGELETLKKKIWDLFEKPKFTEKELPQEFLSPQLSVACLMSITLASHEFKSWADKNGIEQKISNLQMPLDGGWKTHNYGLVPSRLWALKKIAAALDNPGTINASIRAHEQEIARFISSWENDYMGTHWLPQYCIMALS